MKKANKENIKKEKKIKQSNISKSNKILIMILSAIAVIGIIFGAFKIVQFISNSRYTSYEEKMNTYGFNLLYNNQSAKSTDKVTKSEVIKLVIAATLNIKDSSSIIIEDIGENKYKNEEWVNYAINMNISEHNQINESNHSTSETYMNALIYLYNAKRILKEEELNKTETPTFNNYKKLTDIEKESLQDAISTNIIKNSKSKFNTKKILSKGMLNKTIIDFVEKNNYITNGSKIVTDISKMPSNFDEFPYIVEGVDKSTYETKQYAIFEEDHATAKEVYPSRKDTYFAIDEIVNKYFDLILNVDYNTISKENIINVLSETAVNEYATEEEITKYVEYVKTNKIQMTGKPEIQYPIIYFDGGRFRVRTKITYEVKNANVLENLMLLDIKEEIPLNYELGTKELMLDVPVEMYKNCPIYVRQGKLNDNIAGSVKNTETYINEYVEGGK